MVIFALGITRISPLLRESVLTGGVGIAMITVGVLIHFYGAVSYWLVMRKLEHGGDYTPDCVGNTVLLFLALGVAAVVVYVLLVDGFDKSFE